MGLRLHVIAWLFFLACGVIYLIASIRDNDPLMFAGSACFVIGVVLFLYPVKAKINSPQDKGNPALNRDKKTSDVDERM